MPTKLPTESPEAPKPKALPKSQPEKTATTKPVAAKVDKEPKSVHAVAVNTHGESLAAAGLALAIASIFTNVFTFGIMAIVSLILSIIGRIQTKKAGKSSSIALAGIIISGIVMFLTFVGFVLLIVLAALSGGHYGIDCSSSSFENHEFCQPSHEETPRRDTPDRSPSPYELNGM